jgi:hypothetical protein
MKSLGILVGVGLAVAIASTSAGAFEEQSGNPPAAQTAVPEKAMPDSKAAGLASSGAAGMSAEGTEVRIPGLGKLGVLPKMDFGLELLYGASEAKPAADEERELPADDLTIRGTVKHQF